MFRDRVQEALQVNAATTLHRMRTEAESLRPQLAKLVTYVADHLFDPDLNVGSAQRATGLRDQSLSTILRDTLGQPLRSYIEAARIEVAERMLRTTQHEIGRISYAVGYACHSTFVRAFTKRTGKRPVDVRRSLREPAVDYATWYRALNGELNPDEARDLIEALRRLYPDPDKTPEETKAEAALVPSPIRVDGAEFERFRAAEIWQEMRGLPLALQKQRVSLYRFQSSAFFDVLREASRREGRSDRQRGIALAELALESLADSDAVFGDRIHDLRALGWAWLGNAHRLALDFPEAEAAFKKANKTWLLPRKTQDQAVFGELCRLNGVLRLFQRDYGEAFRLVERSRLLVHSVGDDLGEVKALIQLGAIHGYSNELELERAAFQRAEKLLENHDDLYLRFITYANLAKTFTKVERFDDALAKLSESKELCRKLGLWTHWHQVQWVEGDIYRGLGDFAEAEKVYSKARAGFAETEECGCFGLVSLDLAILCLGRQSGPEVLDIVSGAIPVLESLRLYRETLIAVRLLAETVRSGKVHLRALQEARQSLDQDPLACFPQRYEK